MEIKIQKEKQISNAISAKRRRYFVIAGHRGAKTGAIGYIDEGAEAIRLRDAITNELKKKGCIVMNDNPKDELKSVVSFVNNNCEPSDICIDLHFNASSNKSAKGTECFIRVNSEKSIEKVLAACIASDISRVLKTTNRGVKFDNQGAHTRLAMCRDIKCNSVLVEVCFVTNIDDCGQYGNNFDVLARSIAFTLTNI